MPKYWLFKSEPAEFSLDDLSAAENRTVRWDGIRNYQARNFLRDQVSTGDLVLFYHSSCKNTGIAGICRVVSAPYPDPTQFDPQSKYYDRGATASRPKWFCADIALVKKCDPVLPTARLRENQGLETMVLFSNPRLSIQPVREDEWLAISPLMEDSK